MKAIIMGISGNRREVTLVFEGEVDKNLKQGESIELFLFSALSWQPVPDAPVEWQQEDDGTGFK